MRVDHLVYHIPRCGGTTLEEVLREHSSAPLRCDRIKDGKIVLEVMREGTAGVVVLSQDPKWLSCAENVYVVVRDPVHRAISLYHHLQECNPGQARDGLDADLVAWEDKSIDEYLSGYQLEHDWMTRALGGGVFQGECTDDTFQEALVRLCGSNVFLLSELDELVREMRKRGVRITDIDGAEKVMERKRNGAKGERNLSPENADKIIAANGYDCRLWDIAQVLARKRRL
jgi:hypothetical protein